MHNMWKRQFWHSKMGGRQTKYNLVDFEYPTKSPKDSVKKTILIEKGIQDIRKWYQTEVDIISFILANKITFNPKSPISSITKSLNFSYYCVIQKLMIEWEASEALTEASGKLMCKMMCKSGDESITRKNNFIMSFTKTPGLRFTEVSGGPSKAIPISNRSAKNKDDWQIENPNPWNWIFRNRKPSFGRFSKFTPAPKPFRQSLSAVIAKLDTFGTLVPRISAIVKKCHNL